MKEYKYFLDTNIFLRPIVKDDLKKTKECEAVFERIQKGKIKALTSTLVLAELLMFAYWINSPIPPIPLIFSQNLRLFNVNLIGKTQ